MTVTAELTQEQLLRGYRTMRTIREFEERLHIEIANAQIPGFVHLYAGEEAVAAGVCASLADTDWVSSTHRGHGHAIAKGCDVKGMMAEIYGRATGLCKGKGGSMHIADMKKGMLGANAIVGGGPPIAAGAALTAKTLGNGKVSVAFIGDGASDQGTVAESLNLATVLQLPMIFLYENNHYAEFTKSPKPDGRIAARAGAYGMPAVTIDGSDFFTVYETLAEAVERGRTGGGPTAVEAIATRYYGHFEGDPQQYRDAAEIAAARTNADPIEKFLQDPRCKDLDPAQIAAIDADIQSSLDAAVERALAADDPTPDQLYTDVYLSYRGETA